MMNMKLSAFLAIFTLVLASCALTRDVVYPATAVHAQAAAAAYVRVHVVVSYNVLFCNPQNTDECIPAGLIRGPVSNGSGGIIRHNEKSTTILTAAHVIANARKKPSIDARSISRFLDELSSIYKITKEELLARIMSQHIKLEGVEAKILVIASDSNAYEASLTSFKCHEKYDICTFETELIEGVDPLDISESAPSVGDRVLIASGPFGNAYPGSMVPIFEGIYSGSTPEFENDNTASVAKDYYTLQTSPGSSGSLILDSSGEVVGVVSMLMFGPFCLENQPCYPFPAGVTVSIPHFVIKGLCLEEEQE